MRQLISLLGTAVLASTISAQSPRDSLVVSTTWLAQRLNDPKIVVLHVGDKAEYDAKHIPGARYVQLSDISVSGANAGGLSLELPNVDTLRARLAAFDISNDSRIIVSYGKDRITSATRLIFTLDYAGLGRATSLLDGGFEAWVAESGRISDVAPSQKTGDLGALRTRSMVVDADYVRAHVGKPGTSVIDARATAFYDGTQTGGGRGTPHQTGHIAGASNVPFTEITDATYKLRPIAELAALFAKAGVQRGDTVVTYCHIGQQASAVLFAARTLGYPVLLYDGSFEDWSRHPDYPVANPASKGRQ
jgi:thiosulfate/3-mercaptopyruvate sulfurtransferase